jgi:hypothetical protein
LGNVLDIAAAADVVVDDIEEDLLVFADERLESGIIAALASAHQIEIFCRIFLSPHNGGSRLEVLDSPRKLPPGGPVIHYMFTICSLYIHLARE